MVDDLERAYIERLLRQTRGRVRETAELAGLQPRNLYAKMRRLGIRKEKFRSLWREAGGP